MKVKCTLIWPDNSDVNETIYIDEDKIRFFAEIFEYNINVRYATGCEVWEFKRDSSKVIMSVER